MIQDTDEVLPIGTDVRARYRTLSIVGRGGVGTVYRVKDLQTGGTFALKELANPSASARKQFENEAQWLQAVDHPNIPKVRAYFEWGPRVYLVMDFVEGENLEQKLARAGGRPLSEEQVLAWVLPICDALQNLHAQLPPILHRDVKPANIIVTPAGYPVLVDLGIAKEHLPGAGQTATFVKKAGTEGYAPPEQYTSAGKTGPWSDVYGMGATLYELLTGTLPPTAVERVALDSPLLRPRTINPALSPAVDDAVMRALALRPADRFQSMLDLARALRAAIRPSAPGFAPGIPSGPTSGMASAPSLTPVAPVAPVGGVYPGGYPSAPMSQPSGSYGGVAGLDMASAASSPSSPVVASLPSLDPPELSVPSPISPPLQTSNPGISYSSRGAVLPPLEHEAPVSTPRRTRAATKPAEPREGQSSREGRDDREGAEPTRSRGIPWLLGVIGVLVVLAVAAGALAIFTLGPLAPPDRSSPQATTTGYFAALAARDYNRAWAYLADSRNAPGTQTSDIASLKTDDDQYGQVHSARILSLQQGPVGSAQATVAVQRGGAPTTMNYALVLTLYDGQTWLISSVSSS